ncbi:hypothetical protein HanOQP8_Chr14g0538801 [Helianthus annuus]|nr:hypothetical protein HanOQP8_Chr14g0538801 [Helianthus annuus]
MITRWINGVFQRQKTEELQQCFLCSQFGIPNFHSTKCDPASHSSWEALAGSSLVPIGSRKRTDQKSQKSSMGGHPCHVLDPRNDRLLWWNRMLLLARFAALAVDPFFLFALAVDDDGGDGGGAVCVYIVERVVRAVSIVRTCVDAMHLCHVWLQFRLAYVSRESLVVGCGKLVWDARDIAFHYLGSLRGFWLDVFVVLPIPQVNKFMFCFMT